MSYIKDMQTELKRAVASMEKLNNDSRSRKMTDDEKSSFASAEALANSLSSKIANAREGLRPGMPKTKTSKRDKRRTVVDESFSRYLKYGDATGLTPSLEQRADGTGWSTAPNDYGTSAGATGPYGGYLVPQGFWQNLQVALRAFGGTAADFRQVNTDSGQPMPWPTIDPTAVSASLLTSELNQMSIVNPYVFGQGMLNAWTIEVGPVLASIQMINDSAFDVDSFIADRFGEAIGREIAQLAMTGTGSGQPLGIITALDAKGSGGQSGGYVPLSTALAVKNLSGTNPTELAGNILSPQTLLNMIAQVDPAYRAMGAKFYMNDAQLAGLRSVVDLYGHPLLQDPSHESGAPTLWGYPVVVDPTVPNLTASTTGGPIFGNMNAAMVQRNVNGPSIMRLTERWADYLAVGYLGWLRMDTRSNDLRAAVTVKPAAT